MTREAALSVVLAHVVRNKEDFPTRAEHEALRRDCEECCPALVAKPGDLFILRALNLIQGTQYTHTNFTVEYQGMFVAPASFTWNVTLTDLGLTHTY